MIYSEKKLLPLALLAKILYRTACALATILIRAVFSLVAKKAQRTSE